ncbi:hypothetical protein [uncultured Bacteroides sp.]|uniref:hypothetical protein n=1 Tax=uncultured Bacteroides sp. TaxID=162156 RepID=UPI0025D1465A|nr:hypothetical protein [uncultured Bacteroides sp.]
MEKYKHPGIGFIWYLILSIPIITYFTEYSNSSLTTCCFIAFGLRLTIYYLSKKSAEYSIERTAAELTNANGTKELEKIVQEVMKESNTLKLYLLRMIISKIEHSTIIPSPIKEPIANGRPCYYTCPITIIKKKKDKDNNDYYDLSNGKDGKLYIFNNNVEWFEGDAHRALPIKNILKMNLDCSGEILSAVRRNEGSPIHLHTPNAIIIMGIVEQIQNGK